MRRLKLALSVPISVLAILFALFGCDAPRDGAPAAGGDSLGAASGTGSGSGSGSGTAADTTARRMTYLLAAKAYLDGWQATTARLDSASAIPDTTRDVDVASALMLGKATEQHLFKAFQAAARLSPNPEFDSRLRALHAARRATVEHYEAYLTDGTPEELELAREGSAAEAELAAPLWVELRAMTAP